MASSSNITKHMAVVGSDGQNIGTVDDVSGDHLKLTRSGSPDGHHHYVPIGWVSRVDDRVHLNRPGTDVLALGTSAGTNGNGGEHILPPIANPAVGDGVKRHNYYLPWFLLALALLALLILLTRSCTHETTADRKVPATAASAGALPVEAVTLPGGAKVDVAPGTLNYELQRYLGSDEPTPRAFTFDKLNFDTAKSAIRAEDQATVDTLAQILNAYPNARARIVGYADARGSSPRNADLGKARADAVVGALVAKGIATNRLEAASGGETNPVASNATAPGRFENRRTDLVVTAK